jgi:hypothetical protein
MERRRALILVMLITAAADMAIAQGYGGPSMLSRGGNRPGRRGRTPIGVSAYVAVRGTAESGLTPVRLDEDSGSLSYDRVYGVQVEGGAYGSHSWRRTTLGLDYRGDYRETTSSLYSAYNGINQAISVELEHQPTPRISLMFREVGGTTNRAFGGFAAPAATHAQSLNLVNNEVFDTRSYFSTTTGAVAYRKSARTTLSLMGDGFFVKRPDPRLISNTGVRATAGVDYRTSRRSSVGTQYAFMRFSYPRAYAGATIHGLSISFARAVTRSVELSGSAGVLRLNTFGTQQVQLSPEVAAILGRSSGVEAFRSVAYLSQMSAGIVYTMERSIFSASISDGVTPGNGVYMTSRARTASIGYSFAGIRKLSAGLSANFTRMSSQGVVMGALQQFNAGGGINYVLTRMLNFSTQFDYRTFSSPGLSGREGYSLAIGISMSPARLPLGIW